MKYDFFNQWDISGKIVSDITKTNNKVIFTLSNRVADKVGIRVEVRCFKEAAERFDEKGLSKGSLVGLLRGIVYSDGKKIVVKVEKFSQIINMSMRKESLDLGTEKFI